MSSVPDGHRKRIKHFDVHRQPRLLTFSCYDRLPLLREQRWCELLAESLVRAVEGHGFVMTAFVFMPDHVHLVVLPWREGAAASGLLYAIKRPMSFRVKQEMEAREDPRLGELMVRERPGKFAFRFWQEGPGHDRNIRSLVGVDKAVAYVHNNPVKRGLCERPEDWRWSSAGQYVGREVEVGVPKVVRWVWGRGLERRRGDVGEGEAVS